MELKPQSNDDIQKRLDSLPPEIHKLLYSNEVDVIVQQIGVKNRLHLDQTGLLLAEINQVMTGELQVEGFAKELMDLFRIDEDRANAIAKDVDEMLFSKVRDAMKKVYEEQKKPAPIATDGVTPPPQSKLPPLVPKQSGLQTMPTSPMPPTAPTPTPPVAASKPITPPVTPTPPPVAPKEPLPAVPMTPADTMLSQKTVEIAKAPPPAPGSYKQDPYREPAE